eukprot:TRINITY_DN4369_c0_g1_i1.p1 TRINITY_DN4369_c0_g1~~TRINITY_DN4369_c0_g1_i1.p1  ORF type:complete len:379 (+),score=48.54 TRINITY_DN4369_c0_g1_i1:153-1289(+)
MPSSQPSPSMENDFSVELQRAVIPSLETSSLVLIFLVCFQLFGGLGGEYLATLQSLTYPTAFSLPKLTYLLLWNSVVTSLLLYITYFSYQKIFARTPRYLVEFFLILAIQHLMWAVAHTKRYLFLSTILLFIHLISQIFYLRFVRKLSRRGRISSPNFFPFPPTFPLSLWLGFTIYSFFALLSYLLQQSKWRFLYHWARDYQYFFLLCSISMAGSLRVLWTRPRDGALAIMSVCFMFSLWSEGRWELVDFRNRSVSVGLPIISSFVLAANIAIAGVYSILGKKNQVEHETVIPEIVEKRNTKRKSARSPKYSRSLPSVISKWEVQIEKEEEFVFAKTEKILPPLSLPLAFSVPLDPFAQEEITATNGALLMNPLFEED